MARATTNDKPTPKPKRLSKRTVSVTEAAEELGLSVPTVRRYCRLGLVGEFIERFGWYLLAPEEVKWLKNEANRPQPGRPPDES